jgi:uncharacterized protein
MESFTPYSALAGGLLIGLSVSQLLWFNGRIAGISGIARGLLSGYCPGPAIALLAAPNSEALYFLPAMLAGWWLYHLAVRGSKRRGDG